CAGERLQMKDALDQRISTPRRPRIHRALAAALLMVAATTAAAAEVQLTVDGKMKSDPVFVGPKCDEVVYTAHLSPKSLRLMRLNVEKKVAEPLHPNEP